MIQFFISALLLGAIGGAAVGYSKFGRGKPSSQAAGWALWLVVVAALSVTTYGMSVPVYSLQVSERQLYLGLGAAAILYVAALLLVKRCIQRPQRASGGEAS